MNEMDRGLILIEKGFAAVEEMKNRIVAAENEGKEIDDDTLDSWTDEATAVVEKGYTAPTPTAFGLGRKLELILAFDSEDLPDELCPILAEAAAVLKRRRGGDLD